MTIAETWNAYTDFTARLLEYRGGRRPEILSLSDKAGALTYGTER